MENTFQSQNTEQKKSGFLKRNWFLILLAFAATVIVLAKIFLTKPQETVQAPTTPPAPTWNEITPGTTTIEQVRQKLGEPKTVVPEGDYLKFLYPSQSDGPEHEVLFSGTSAVLIKDRILGNGNIASFRQKYGPSEREFWGEHKSVGFKTYVWAARGIVVVAHENSGLIYESWYFTPQTMEQFLVVWGKDLTVDFSPDGY